MTREEAITLIDELRVCIKEHPIIAYWLAEIADRKTEPSCDTCKLKDTTEWCKRQEVCRAYQPKDEPQTGDKCNDCIHLVFDGYWYCECHECNYEPKTEPSNSEKPNNCETCRFDDKYGEESVCSGCSRYYSGCYAPKDEPQADDLIRQADEMIKFDKELLQMGEEQTDDGTAFIKRHGLRVDYGDEVPCDLKPFIDW